MEVEKNIPFSHFKKDYKEVKYLKSKAAGDNVVIAKHFWYFGDRAINVPKNLQHIIIDRQGCKCVTDADIETLKEYLASDPSFKITGKPNNPVLKPIKKNC